MNLPYIGSFGRFHVPNSEIRWYGGECQEFYEQYLAEHDVGTIADCDRVDGDWCYRFNSSGFRGEGYNAGADYTVAIIGCSVSFGEGVPWDKTWGKQLCSLISAKFNLPLVQCLNFSQSGASNDYITRTAIRQCRAQLPSLLVAYFTNVARKELVREDGIHSFGAWCADENELYRAQLAVYSHEEAVLNTAKNVLLLQDFCKRHELPYLIVIQEREFLDGKEVLAHPIIGDYCQMIDWTRVADFRMKWLDRARDNRHPGVLSQRQFAKNLLSFLISRGTIVA